MLPGRAKPTNIIIETKIIKESGKRIIVQKNKDYSENAPDIIAQHLARIFLATNKKKIDEAIDNLKMDM